MFCLDAESGKLLWRTNTSKAPPFGDGGFYSSPAIAFGRVYAARDDGTIFAFDEESGKVAWSFPTNDYVYGSPAVAKVPGTPPSVYIGSYDEHFYALDARPASRVALSRRRRGAGHRDRDRQHRLRLELQDRKHDRD